MEIIRTKTSPLLISATLKNIGKRYQKEWVFKGVNATFEKGSCCAILGSNGSGKSTLLQIIAGFLTPSDGDIYWQKDDLNIPYESLYTQLAWCTPMLQLYDDFTLRENISFLLKFKKLRGGIDVREFSQLIDLEKHLDKQMRFFSSGMRQRVKLGMAILAEASLLLLDEPTSHLDSKAVNWYQNLLEVNSADRLIFIASNSDSDEIFLCQERLLIDDFK